MKINRFNRARVLTSKELDVLHDYLSGPNAVLASLLRRTGARVSEGLQLRWKYVTPSSIVLIAPTVKGKTKTRAIPLHPLLAEELTAWKLGTFFPTVLHPSYLRFSFRLLMLLLSY